MFLCLVLSVEIRNFLIYVNYDVFFFFFFLIIIRVFHARNVEFL